MQIDLLIFINIGIFFGLFYGLGSRQIGAYNWDDGYGKKKEHIKNACVEAPFWLASHIWMNFIGVFAGWMLLWYLLNKHGFFSNNIDKNSTLDDLVLFSLSFIGIIGKLPDLFISIINGLRNGLDKLFGPR